jgi:glycosyltransferase involved in cell wall biosynthesis
MRFFAFKKDINTKPVKTDGEQGFLVDDSTSVVQHKKHFFEALKTIGELIPMDDTISLKEAQHIFSKPDTIFAQMHNAVPLSRWNQIPKRTLCHSLGDFLLPDVFFQPQSFKHDTTNLVTSDFQRKRLNKHLGKAAPAMAVFTPKLNEADFYPPNIKEKIKAREDLTLGKNDIHIVYAGRWLATKGICQLLRTLDLWPDKNVKISLVGNFTPSFPLRMSSTSHYTFGDYFKREFLTPNNSKQIQLLPGRTPNDLRKLFWSADLFVYASTHEDENFGMSPREAALCGVPVVVTDFCGLHQIGEQMPWGYIGTYPTFGGIRYSLKQFRILLGKAAKKKDWDSEYSIKFVKKECSLSLSTKNMQEAASRLLKNKIEPMLDQKAARKKLMFDIIRYADEKVATAFIEKEEKFIDGGYVDGTGFYNKDSRIENYYKPYKECILLTTKRLW